MAQTTEVVLVDDLDGGEAEQTVTFALDGVTYEIDLSAANAVRLRESFATWVGHGRRVTGRGAGAPGRPRGRERSTSPEGVSGPGVSGSGVSGSGAAAVRAWARENGHRVSDRGRVPAALLKAYRAARA